MLILCGAVFRRGQRAPRRPPRTKKRKKMRALLMTLAMLALSLPLRAGEGAKVEEIAERMAAATVGVYCRVGEFDRYYGSGVVVAADGWILTSTTAVPAGAEAVEVYFADHSRAPATVVEIHAEVEAALLKVERAGLASLPINPAMPGVGEPAYASGNVNNVLKLGDGAAFSAGDRLQPQKTCPVPKVRSNLPGWVSDSTENMTRSFSRLVLFLQEMQMADPPAAWFPQWGHV